MNTNSAKKRADQLATGCGSKNLEPPGFNIAGSRTTNQVLNRFEKAKFRSEKLRNYMLNILEDASEFSLAYRKEIENRRKKLFECGSILTIRDYFETGKIKHSSRRCRQHLLCPGCAIIRGARTMGNIVNRVQQKELHKYYPYLLTVTVKDGESLPERFQNLASNWSKLIDRRKGRGDTNRGSNALRALVGGVATIEIKRGKNSQLWHPHIHALVFADRKLEVEQDYRGAYRWPALSQEWERITGDSKIIECHPIKDTGGELITPENALLEVSSENKQLMANGFIQAVCEVSKYALKMGDMADQDVLEAWQSVKGKRLIRTFGEMFGKVEDDSDPNSEELGAYLETVYQWTKKGYSASKISINRSKNYIQPPKVENPIRLPKKKINSQIPKTVTKKANHKRMPEAKRFEESGMSLF